MSLEKKRKTLELKRVETARMDLEFKIDERLHEIEKLKEHIAIQIATEEKLKKEINTL